MDTGTIPSKSPRRIDGRVKRTSLASPATALALPAICAAELS
jgi:hypothetical protein